MSNYKTFHLHLDISFSYPSLLMSSSPINISIYFQKSLMRLHSNSLPVCNNGIRCHVAMHHGRSRDKTWPIRAGLRNAWQEAGISPGLKAFWSGVIVCYINVWFGFKYILFHWDNRTCSGQKYHAFYPFKASILLTTGGRFLVSIELRMFSDMQAYFKPYFLRCKETYFISNLKTCHIYLDF